MFSFGRLMEFLGQTSSDLGDVTLVARILAEPEMFTGPGWEQEDDVTLVTLLIRANHQ